ncbi:MAG TPA: MT-A70 family methyltransferase [Micromonosporaceae bacterium]
MSRPQWHPVADIFPMMSDREYRDLVEDIRAHGLREPVWTHRDGRIIDGRNRWLACAELGIEPQTKVYEGDDAGLVSFVVSLNLRRRHLNESQRAMVAARIERLRHGGKRQDANLHLDRDDAARLLNVSPRSIASAKKVQALGIPELGQKVESGGVSVSTAAVIADVPEEQQREVIAADDEREIIRRAKEIAARRREQRLREKAERVAEIKKRQTAPLSSLGPFPVLYADPPWRYEYAESSTRKVENQYPTMSLDEIKALEVPAANDAVLFLWVTSPKLPEGLEVMQAWGFEYRTNMVWVKDRIGMGYYARQQHELLLIGKRGNLPVPDPEDRPSSVITASRGEHSAKPDQVYDLIERMYPLRERCELFQRRPRDGWVGWGNQA